MGSFVLVFSVVLPCCCLDVVLSPRVHGTPVVLCVTFTPLPGVESASAVFPLGLGISPWPAPGPVGHVTGRWTDSLVQRGAPRFVVSLPYPLA